MRTADLITQKRPPDKKWMLQLISAMDPGNDIFKKDYVRPRPVIENPILNLGKTVPNVGGFFNGLPISSARHVRGRGRMNFVPKEIQKKIKLERLRNRL